MPSSKTLAAFIRTVVENRHLEAIQLFYAPHATMRENLAEPRRGRDALVDHERAVLGRVVRMFTYPPHSVISQGDSVAIRWTFDVVDPSGEVRRLEEVALQRWENEQIVEEEFIYDSATAWRVVDGSPLSAKRSN
jgi:ketosteroid isomerase-like protein